MGELKESEIEKVACECVRERESAHNTFIINIKSYNCWQFSVCMSVCFRLHIAILLGVGTSSAFLLQIELHIDTHSHATWKGLLVDAVHFYIFCVCQRFSIGILGSEFFFSFACAVLRHINFPIFPFAIPSEWRKASYMIH